VQNLAIPQKTSDILPVPGRHFPAPLALGVLLLAALWFVLFSQLSGEWSVNAQYNYGWFVPLFALYLFWLRWQDRPAPEVRGPKSEVRHGESVLWRIRSRTLIASALAIVSLFLLLPIRLFEVANPEWRLLAWIHALVVVTLTLLLLWWAGGKAWLRQFAFPVVFILVAVPWPTVLETPVIQGLMRGVAHVATETAMLLGTPAQVEGNLIRVSNGLVGVNEACSGIRSLQTSLMIGLLFGELKLLSVLRRVALVACAVAIALLANFVRAVFLVHIAATENLSEVGRWHDIAGYSIIAVVFVATLVLAHLFGKSEIRNPKSEPRRQKSEIRGQTPHSAFRIPQFGIIFALCWLLLVEVASAAWYRVHEKNLITGIPWSVQWPEQASNFRKLKIDEEIRSVLRFDEGHGAAWTMTSTPNSGNAAPSKDFGVPEPNGKAMPFAGQRDNTISCLLYSFRWKPGRSSALLANLHRPDVCLPASGWTQVADHGVRSYLISDSVELPFRHFEFQRSFEGSPPQIAHAFYCLSEDRASGGSASLGKTDSPGMFGNRSEWTRSERLRAVLDGRRHLGQQVIEAIFISNEPLSAAEAETHLRDFIRDVVRSREAI
jgi:exosortase